MMTRREERRTLLLALLACILLSPVLAAQEYTTTDEDVISGLLARAYAALPDDKVAALQLFEQVIRHDSTNLLARKQLGLLYISFNRYEDALNEFVAVQRLSPSDTTELQIAYLLNTLGRNREAHSVFSRLHSSSDGSIREKARVATSVLSAMLCQQSAAWWGKMYAASYYESRFNDVIFFGNLYGGHYLIPSRVLSAYGVLSVTYDTRSKGGTLPVIFSDNYTLLGAGLRIRQSDSFFADVQLGVAYDLLERSTRTRGDVRALLVYGNGIFPDLAIPERLAFSLKPFADVYTSTGYYSRYRNVIGYYQARAGLRVLEWMYSSVDVYARGDCIADTRREFYNNVLEGSIGVRVNAYQPWGISVLAELHRGLYWARQVPVDRSYDTFRLFLVIDTMLCF